MAGSQIFGQCFSITCFCNLINFITYCIILLALNRSAGATVVEMLTRHPPWYKLKDFQVMFRIGIKEKPENLLDSSLGPEVRSFLAVTFNYNSERRPSAEELLEHDWLSDIIEGIFFLQK